MIRLLYVYIVCFTFGVLYSLIAAVFGSHHSGGGEGGQLDADGSHVSGVAGHQGVMGHSGISAPDVDGINGAPEMDMDITGTEVPGATGLETGTADGLPAGQPELAGHDSSHIHDHSYNGNDGGNVNPSPFNTTVIFSSVAAFGGVGLIGKLGFKMSDPLSALLAVGCSAIVGVVIFFGVVKLIYNSQSNTTFSGRDLIGADAEVNIPIPADGLGVVACVIRGTRHTLSARSRNGTKISQGEKVKIKEISSNVAVVTRKISADDYDFDRMKESRKSSRTKT